MRSKTLAAMLGVAAAPLAQEVPLPSPVPQLRGSLRAADAAVRLTAAEALGSRPDTDNGLPCHAAVADLMRIVADDPDENVAGGAALALDAIGSWPPGVFEFVAERLDSWRMAGAPGEVITRLGDALQHRDRGWPGTTMVPDLALLTHEPACARGALVALAVLGDGAKPAMPDVDALVSEQPEAVRWRAAFTLARIGGTRAPSLAIARGDAGREVRLWALHCVDAEHVTAEELAPWFDDARVAVRKWAVGRVVAMGAKARVLVPKLGPLLAAWETSREAQQALSGLGAHAVALAPVLVDWLDDERLFPIAAAGLEAVGPAAKAAACDSLAAIVGRPLSTDPNWFSLREEQVHLAAKALAAIDAERAVGALWPGFAAPLATDWPGDWHLVTRFLFVGAAAATKMPDLRAMLRAGDVRDRLRALMAIKGIGAGAVAALPEVERLLRDDDERVRNTAAEAVLAMGAAAVSALPDLDLAFTNRPANRRHELLIGLAAFGSAAEPLLRRGLAEGDEWTRRIAAVQLLSAPTLSAAATAVLRDSTDFDVYDCFVRRRWPALCQGPMRLQAWTPGCWIGDLTSLVSARRTSLQELSARAVLDDERLLTAWVIGFATESDPTLRAAAAHVLGLLPSTKDSLAALRELAVDTDRNTRLAALWALGRPDARPAVGVLVAALGDEDWTVAATANMALRGMFAR